MPAGHHRHQVHADQAGPGRRFFLERGKIEFAVGRVRDHGIGHALDADQRGQRAGVDAAKPDDAARLQPVVEVAGGAVVRRRRDGAVQDDAARARRRRHVDGLDVVLVGADIADMREGEGDDLPGIGGVGEDLLIAGHGGIEADLADRAAGGAQAHSLPARSRRPAPKAPSAWVHPKRRRGRLSSGSWPLSCVLCMGRQEPPFVDPLLIPPPFRGRKAGAAPVSLPLKGGGLGWGSSSNFGGENRAARRHQ